MQDSFQRSSPSAELVTVLRRQKALVSHLYRFSPTHDVSHPSFQVFTTLPQSHIPHPGQDLLWPCSKTVPAVSQGPNQTSWFVIVFTMLLRVFWQTLPLWPPLCLLPAREVPPPPWHRGPRWCCFTETICELPPWSYACTSKGRRWPALQGCPPTSRLWLNSRQNADVSQSS